MADSSSTGIAAVAIVVLVIVALFFLFGRSAEDQSDIEIDLPNVELKQQ